MLLCEEDDKLYLAPLFAHGSLLLFFFFNSQNNKDKMTSLVIQLLTFESKEKME